MDDFYDWEAELTRAINRRSNRFDAPPPPAPPLPPAPPPPVAPASTASPNLPSVRPTNVAGQYSDINQILLGHDIKNQLFSQFGLGDYGWSEKAEGESGQYNLGTLTPEAQAALQGYTFNWTPSGERNEGLLAVLDPQGQQAGRFYQTPGQSTGESLREYAGMLASATNFLFPGLTAGLLSPVTNAVSSGVTGALGTGTLGNIASAAATGAVKSGIGSLISGGDFKDALLTGAIGGAASPLASSLVEPLGLPQPLTNIATRGLTAELVGKDAEKALINAALGELLAATREQPMPQGMTPREQAAFLEANLSELQSAPLYEFPSVEMSPREREAFLEANIPEPEVVQQLMQGYYPDLEPIASRTSMTPNEMNQFLEANIEEPAVIDQLMSTYYPELIPSGNLEQDFVVAQRPEGPVIEDTAGNRGEFIDGAWTVRTDPIQFSDYVAPPPVAAAPAPAPAPAPAAAPAAPPPPAPTASRGLDIGALMAMMGAMGAGQPQQRDEYQLANVEPGVKSALALIEQMYGRG